MVYRSYLGDGSSRLSHMCGYEKRMLAVVRYGGVARSDAEREGRTALLQNLAKIPNVRNSLIYKDIVNDNDSPLTILLYLYIDKENVPIGTKK